MNRVKGELNPHYDDAHKVVYMMVKKFGGKVPGRENEPDPTDANVAEDVTMSKI